MSVTGIIRVPLSELRTNDEQVIGSLYQVRQKTYRYVKNAGSTALVARASCSELLTSVEDGMKTRVISPDIASGACTASVYMPAGMPVTSIGGSGSGTGCYGWVQCKGPAKVSVIRTSNAIAIGSFAIGTGTYPASAAFGIPFIPSADSSILSYSGSGRTRGVIIMSAMAETTGAVTHAASALVDIQCLA